MYSCYPDSISSLRIRDKLLSTDLLSPSTDEKSQLRRLQHCINQVFADQTSIEIQDGGRVYRSQITQGHHHPIRPDGMSSLILPQVIEKEIRSVFPPTLRAEVDSIFS